jgi:small subunit ribosomal protein S19e
MDEIGRKLVKLSEELKKEKIAEMPEWARFVKTGVSREKVPIQDNWWQLRSASVLRKVYLNGPIGAERLSNHFGGRKNRGSKTDKVFPGSTKILRVILQQLEAGGLVEQSKTAKKGRILTKKGFEYISKSGLERLK